MKDKELSLKEKIIALKLRKESKKARTKTMAKIVGKSKSEIDAMKTEAKERGLAESRSAFNVGRDKAFAKEQAVSKQTTKPFFKSNSTGFNSQFGDKKSVTIFKVKPKVVEVVEVKSTMGPKNKGALQHLKKLTENDKVKSNGTTLTFNNSLSKTESTDSKGTKSESSINHGLGALAIAGLAEATVKDKLDWKTGKKTSPIERLKNVVQGKIKPEVKVEAKPHGINPKNAKIQANKERKQAKHFKNNPNDLKKKINWKTGKMEASLKDKIKSRLIKSKKVLKKGVKGLGKLAKKIPYVGAVLALGLSAYEWDNMTGAEQQEELRKAGALSGNYRPKTTGA